MLVEIKNVRQIQGEPERRWFSSQDMDLIVWQDKDVIAFQLSYDKSSDEHALSWHKDYGLKHHAVDDGEGREGHYKATPILIENGEADLEKIKRIFIENAAAVEDTIKQFVINRLKA